MQQENNDRFERLYAKTSEVRTAQKAYYAYRPKTELDQEHKRDLLRDSKQKERELDGLLQELSRHDQPKQKDLFPAL